MRIALAFVAAVAAVTAAACTGGGGSTGTTGGSSSGALQEPAGSAGQEDAYCEAAASHRTCNGGTSTEPCSESGKCIYGRLMSRTAADAYFACHSAPSCKGDDSCAAEAGRAVGGAAADAYFDECRAKLEACPDSFRDDNCTPGLFAFPTLRDAAQACLARPCGELDDCFARALQPIDDCK